MDLALEVRRMLREERLVCAGDTVVCAVSGGPDSMALLHVLNGLSNEFSLKLIAAHLNHGFRVAESELEEGVVRRFAESLQIPLEVMHADLPAYVRERGMNAQAGAREVRYRFLQETANRYKADSIALAHHLVDQAETVLMNLLSGASLSGLSGMSPSRMDNNMKRIRPFLRIPKETILAYIEQHKIPFCIDSSNKSRKYERNRLRLDILPQLLSFNPSLPDTIGRMADVLRDEEDYLHRSAKKLADAIVVKESNKCIVSRSLFLAEPMALQRRLIKLILNYIAKDVRFSDYSKIESIRTAIERETPPSLSLDIGQSIRFVRVYDQLEWTMVSSDKEAASPSPFAHLIQNEEGMIGVKEAGGLLRLQYMPTTSVDSIHTGPNEALFDADRVQFPLQARSRLAGDRIEPLGVIGSKKVKDMFIDLKIAPKRRDHVPIIVDAADKILWIPGICRSKHALISDHTLRVVRLSFEEIEQ